MTPAALLEELLRYHSAKSRETVWLSTTSHDDICRLTRERINVLLDAFEKYKHIAYVVQGPRDNGVDVLLKGAAAEDEPDKYFGLQIKSYNELGDRKNDLTQKLKAGWVDASHSYMGALERYYILLCGDAVRDAKRISAIANEFAKSPRVRVIEPRNVMAFLKMPASTVAAVVDRHLSEEDYVRKRARGEAAGYRPRQLYFVLACICWALENSSDLLPDDFFQQDSRMHDLVERFGHGSILAGLDEFGDTDLETIAEPFSRRIRVENFGAIRALYFDLAVRYSESEHDLFHHLYEFLVEGSDDGQEDSQ